MPIELPRQQAAIYGVLYNAGDVAISDILNALGIDAANTTFDQQFLGSYITRLNRRLKAHKQRVVPGRMKRTYRLVSALGARMSGERLTSALSLAQRQRAPQ